MSKIDPAYHAEVPQPDDVNTLVWRYMDLAKLLGIVVNQELTLVRVDQLPDKFEGTFPKQAEQAFRDWLVAGNCTKPEDQELHLQNFRKWGPDARGSSFVSCWHLGDYESEAMWRIYCGSGTGLAIVLPYVDLFRSVPHALGLVGEVTYIKYDVETFQPGNPIRNVLHKRKFFEHEKEVRVLAFKGRPTGHAAVAIPWSTSLIKQIVISPYAGSWYFDIVKDTLERLQPGLGALVVESSMVR